MTGARALCNSAGSLVFNRLPTGGGAEGFEHAGTDLLADKANRAVGHRELCPARTFRAAETLPRCVDPLRRVTPVDGMPPGLKVGVHFPNQEGVGSAVGDFRRLHGPVR